MVYILIGILGFFVLFWFDPLAIRKVRLLKPIVWVGGSSLLLYALLMVCIHSSRISLPGWLNLMGGVISLFFSVLIVYSLFVEIPLKKTYMKEGTPARVIKTGTYAFVRHPGVLWWFGFLTGLFLVTESKTLFIALPVWVCVDVIYVIIQDRVFFIKMFGDEYREYQSEVPMLLPNRESLKNCITTFIHD